jgi:seryl-tRNA synthetase
LYTGDDDDKSKDPKFEKLISLFDRVQKSISQQHRALDSMVKKVNKLIERKDKKERKIKKLIEQGEPLEKI